MTEQRKYLAYMLRLWRVDTNGEVTWRVSIEDPHTGERHGFTNLDRLFEFLKGETHDQVDRDSQCLASANSGELTVGYKE